MPNPLPARAARRATNPIRVLKPAFLTAFLALSACGSSRSGTVAVHDPWARETTAGLAVSAGYGRIENGTGDALRLIGAETPAAGRIEIHNATTEGGVMRMRPLADGLEIPAGESVELRPGGYHMMLLDLRQPLRRGETVPVTLRFDHCPPVRADFTIRSTAEAAHGGGHD